MLEYEPTELLSQVTNNSESLIAEIFRNASKIESLDKKISIRLMIKEIEKHKHDLPLFPYSHYTIFHSNCLWEALKRKAVEPKKVEIYLFSSLEDPMHFIWKYQGKYFHFRRAFGKARTEVFLEGYIEPYPCEEHIKKFIRVDNHLNGLIKPQGYRPLEIATLFFSKLFR